MKPKAGYHLPAMASVRLFVYGSLKRAGRHHDELDGALFLGEAETLPGYRLEPLGEYLALVPPDPEPKPDPDLKTRAKAKAEPEHETDPETATAVSGEVFEVDEAKLSALDAFEGDAYERGNVRLNVRLNGEPSQKPGFALAYFKKAR
jgi:gamma-glutamylcyclotransferase (GGCT)/AIG2-like uncharacterized protein YtfP